MKIHNYWDGKTYKIKKNKEGKFFIKELPEVYDYIEECIEHIETFRIKKENKK